MTQFFKLSYSRQENVAQANLCWEKKTEATNSASAAEIDQTSMRHEGGTAAGRCVNDTRSDTDKQPLSGKLLASHRRSLSGCCTMQWSTGTDSTTAAYSRMREKGLLSLKWSENRVNHREHNLIQLHTNVCICVCIYIYIHIHTYTYTHTHTHIYTNTHTHTHTHTHIYTNTHTHTHIYIAFIWRGNTILL